MITLNITTKPKQSRFCVTLPNLKVHSVLTVLHPRESCVGGCSGSASMDGAMYVSKIKVLLKVKKCVFLSKH